MIKDLEKFFYRIQEVGFYTFLKRYDSYINDLEFEQEEGHTAVKDKTTKAIIGYIIIENNEISSWYVNKNYFNIFLDVDFSKMLQRKITQINKTKDKKMVATITKLNYKIKKDE